ncbi:TPA: hypothetical protein ACQWGQ_002051 [Neisseria subflava]|uniref:hypothetical protein n=1 Tax=unclassified Neisseria TaxID=2623750 RepID=UPI003F7F430C
MFDTQRVPVKVYRWDDEGAPQVESAAGSIKTILKACLVTGYGEGNKRKDGLGWEMAFEKTQEACFRSTHPKATKWWLGVDDSKYGERARYVDLCGLLEPTSAKAGKVKQKVNNSSEFCNFIYKKDYNSRDKIQWVVVGNERAFTLIILWQDYCSFFIFGNFASLAVADAANTLLGYVSDVDDNYIYRDGAGVVLFVIPMRDYKGDIASILKFTSKAYANYGSYPNPITGGFIADDIYMNEIIGHNIYALRGLFPGFMKIGEIMPAADVIPMGTVYDNLDDSEDRFMYINTIGGGSFLVNLTAWEL